MKNRRFLIPLLTVLCLICAVLLVSCGSNTEPPASPDTEQTPGGTETPGGETSHTHNLTHHAAVEATCTSEGNLEYWECTACGKFFSDESANTELDGLISTVIPVDTTAHVPSTVWESDDTGHWKICTRDGCTAELNKTTHTYGEWIETLAPSCVAEGSHYQTCSACSYKVSEAIPAAHVPATVWTSDDTGHWKVCTRDGCEAIIEKEPHSYDENNICACAYTYRDFGLVFTLSSGTYKVSGYSGTVAEVGIPSKYKGIAVTAIGSYAFCYCDSLTTVTIPASVTSIGEYAFDGCSSLTTVTFGENSQLQGIGEYAFYGCTGLTTVTFSENSQLQSIGDSAFRDCSSLASISIPAGVTSIGYEAFSYCTSLTTVEFGANSQLTSIGYEAFCNCFSLASISIPAGVRSIGDDAFRGCSSLTTVTFGENSQLQSIDDDAFRGCSSLASISIPAGVTSIGKYVFSGCSSLASITFEDPSGWYRTDKELNWNNKTGGNATSLTDPATNATYFKSTYYYYYYWYKLEE